MYNRTINDLTNNSINIIKNNTPEKSINMISNMTLNDNKNKIGKTQALKIYKAYADESVIYDNKYKNDINRYKNNVEKNVNKATKYSQI
jgi:hypothetical protein